VKWHIPYAGEVLVFDDGRITASEARLQKRITGGMSVIEAENKRLELDPDAWIAALAIARRRGGVTADEAVDIDLDQLELVQIMDRTREAVTAEGPTVVSVPAAT
jgi:predicted nucleic acid-binding protein